MTEFGIAFSLLASAMHGCHRNPSRVRPPEISPSAAGTAAIVAYGRDGNDLLSTEELENLPGVSPERYDNNGDGNSRRTKLHVASANGRPINLDSPPSIAK